MRNELLKRQIGFIQFTVGEKEYSIDINKRKRNKGILFEVPKYSLMQTIKWNIFDDLLNNTSFRDQHKKESHNKN